ncbi:unnamed protein product [Urochloa humidicola]
MGRGRGTQSHEQSVFVTVALCIFASEGRSGEASGCAEEEKKQSKRPQRTPKLDHACWAVTSDAVCSFYPSNLQV